MTHRPQAHPTRRLHHTTIPTPGTPWSNGRTSLRSRSGNSGRGPPSNPTGPSCSERRAVPVTSFFVAKPPVRSGRNPRAV